MIRVCCRLRKSDTSAIQVRGCGKVTFQRRTNLKTDRYDGNSKRFEHGDRRDAAGRLGIERCGETDCGSGTDAQATLCWRTFPHGQGSVRATVHQSPHFTGLPRQENHFLHAVCREDTLQGFGLGKDAGGELQRKRHIALTKNVFPTH